MIDQLGSVLEHRDSFTGTLYLCKPSRFSPANPSGNEGRFNGSGTNTYYLADSPEACWSEVQGYNPSASYDDYLMWSIPLSGTFIDVGAVEGTRFVQPKEKGGWEPTQELSRRLVAESVFGFRYASRTVIEGSSSGTCFCIYQKSLTLADSDFTEEEWYPSK